MGSEKAILQVGGVANAVRLGGLLRQVCDPVLEVGPGRSGLRALNEQPPGQGPLAAVGAGALALLRLGHAGPALVLACDLPFVGVAVLRFLVDWPGTGSVVPLVDERPQPLCARWSTEELAATQALVDAGERSMRALLSRPGVVLAGEGAWPEGVCERDFADLDTPADLERFGFR
jgi:molybdopterin-guanine dinucleotide biosynthesis protein A